MQEDAWTICSYYMRRLQCTVGRVVDGACLTNKYYRRFESCTVHQFADIAQWQSPCLVRM